MEFSAKQIAPPKDWSRFEDLCRALFSAVWGDPYAQKNGRAGQPQHGVDVWGRSRGAHPGTHCVQCKGKDVNYHGTVTRAEFDGELAKAESFDPKPAVWILATTAPNDGDLQAHARKRTEEREAQGLFPVTILGWETLVALMGEHPEVIEQFYPEHGDRMSELIAAVRALPGRDELTQLLSERSVTANLLSSSDLDESWIPASFDVSRGLGPALLGRALGAADAGICPRLPEASVLVTELEGSYSARLAGTPGAGKSVCALQAAETFARKGYRVVRLRNPQVDRIELTRDDIPTVHLIDDAHLARGSAIALAEQSATPSKLLLSAFTTLDMADSVPGTIHLDAKRAVRVIADELRRRAPETLEAVRLVDDLVGDDLGRESLEWRLDTAAVAEFPWQFCFILSGGWRRVRSIVASARAAKADIALCAVAIRQLATRDARTSVNDLGPLLEAAGLLTPDADKALRWLVDQRLVLSSEDLRCPHQRFAAQVFDPILKDQSPEGRMQVAAMMAQILADPAMQLGGLDTLLTAFRMGGSFGGWTGLIGTKALAPFLARCWAAESAEDIASAARALREIDSYLPGAISHPGKLAIETFARWFSAPLPGMAYAVGAYINGTYRNRRYGRAIIRRSDPEAVADALNSALEPGTADFASEIAKMISQSMSALTPDWIARYLARVDLRKCLALVANWPGDSKLYRAAWFCTHFIYLDEDLGLDLIEALGPAIASRMCDDPIDAFDQLEDIFWSSLKVFDPLQVYTGRRAPTARMKAVAGGLCEQWHPQGLAKKLGQISIRQFRDAAGLLNVLSKTAPKSYAATVAAIDWDDVERAIGSDWSKMPYDADIFLCQFRSDAEGRAAVSRLLVKHLDQIDVLGTRLAFVAPAAAFRQVERGARIGLSQEHNDWLLRAGVLGDFNKKRPELVSALLETHLPALAKALSSESPSYFEHALLFLRVCHQVAPQALGAILDQIDVRTAEKGWTIALRGLDDSGRKIRNPGTREAVAWLTHHLRDRADGLGDMARRLRTAFPERVMISAKKLEAFSDL